MTSEANANALARITFWGVLAVMILIVSIMVLMIDMTIKAGILEEAGKLRAVIKGEQDDRSAKAAGNGNSHNGDNSSSVLGVFPTRMETGNVVAEVQEESPARKPARKPRGTRTERGARVNSGEIPEGN